MKIDSAIFIRTFLGFLLLFLVWVMLSFSSVLGPSVIADPKEVTEVIDFEILSNGNQPTILEKNFNINNSYEDIREYENILLHVSQTLLLVLKGWLITLVIGTILGLIFGELNLLNQIFEPIVDFFRSIPPILVFPLLLVTFNYSPIAYVWTIVFGCLPIMILTVSEGVQTRLKEAIELMEVHKATKFSKIIANIFEVIPSIFLGARLTFSFALIIAIVTEMVHSPRSGLAIGSLTRDAQMAFNTPLFYTCVIIVGLFGYWSNSLLKKIEERLN